MRLIRSITGQRNSLLREVGRRYFSAVSIEEYARRNYASNVSEYNTVIGSLTAQRRFLQIRSLIQGRRIFQMKKIMKVHRKFIIHMEFPFHDSLENGFIYLFNQQLIVLSAGIKLVSVLVEVPRMLLMLSLKFGIIPIVVPVGVRDFDIDGEHWVNSGLIPTKAFVGAVIFSRSCNIL